MPLLCLEWGLYQGYSIIIALRFGMQGFYLVWDGVRFDSIHKRAAFGMATHWKLDNNNIIDRINNKWFAWVVYLNNRLTPPAANMPDHARAMRWVRVHQSSIHLWNSDITSNWFKNAKISNSGY